MDMEEQENESGLLDYEAQRYEEEQEILRADPAFCEWLASIATQHIEDYAHAD